MPVPLRKRRLRQVALAAAALIAVGLLAYGFLPEPVEVEVAAVKRGRIVVTVDEDGKTRVRERYIVSAPLTGRLLRVELHAGDAVEAGKTLLSAIEPKSPELLDVRAEAEALARVHAAESAVSRAVPEVARWKAEWEYARDENRRIRQISERGAASATEVQRAMLMERVTAQQLKSADFTLEIARFELALARAALLRTRAATPGSEQTEGRFEIIAPSGGRVLRVLQESSAVVSPGTPLLEIGDPTDLEVVIDVLSSDGARIAAGAPVSLEHWAGEELPPLRAVVRLVEPSAFLKISALGVEEQRVNVIADLTDPPAQRPSLGDGFRVDARIVVWEGQDLLVVPTGALFRRGDSWAAFVISEGHSQLRTVTIGHMSASEAEVLSGLSEGEEVIVHPTDRVHENASVSAMSIQQVPG